MTEILSVRFRTIGLQTPSKRVSSSELAAIGEIIFNTDSLSGEMNIGCHTCHLDELAFTDGLPVAIGVGGSGKEKSRIQSNGILVPRNSFTLKGRGHSGFSSFFWDGKAENLTDDSFTSPFGLLNNEEYNSSLAVAASLPIIARDEFLGVKGVYSNKMLDIVDQSYFMDKYDSASKIINNKINTGDDSDLRELKRLFIELGYENVSLAAIGNALAEFIKRDFSCIDTKWNEYLAGNSNALSERQKRGAELFYGSARCASCHSGALFSDFNFHSISAPQGSVGVSALGQDFGRANITHKSGDRFKFRTPPLVFVNSTPPYGHAGQFKSLEEIVIYHINPIKYLQTYDWTSDREMLQFGKILSSRSALLNYVDLNSKRDIDDIVSFLKAI